jgi:DNA mismatch endonuclease (patch repair protein)
VHYRPPTSNEVYWNTKIDGNMRRDADTDARLVKQGWLVFRVWEHDAVEVAVEEIRLAVITRRPERGSSDDAQSM